MRSIRWKSPLLTDVWRRSRRLRWRDLLVRMCRAIARLRTSFPVPVLLKRLAAPLWVLSFGKMTSLRAAPAHVPPDALLDAGRCGKKFLV